MKTDIKYTIIGGGIIGTAIALELSKITDEEICVLEKNDKITGENQSSRNSGVIHAGIYYDKKIQPLKAEFCVSGNVKLYEFCEKYEIPHVKTGKLVVAFNEDGIEYLEEVKKNADENRVPDSRFLNSKEIKEFEPNISAVSSLYFPSTGIIESTELLKKMSVLAENNGVYFLTGNKVIEIEALENESIITSLTKDGVEKFTSEFLINAAGLYSDEIGKMINKELKLEIDPVRGESAKFYKNSKSELFMNGKNVYPAPYAYYNSNGRKADVTLEEMKDLLGKNEVTKTTGVHLTPTFDLIDGKYEIGNTITIGPQKTVGITKENYGENLHSPESYFEYVTEFFPHIKKDDIELHQTGIMAVLKGNPDWYIKKDEKFNKCLHLIGLDSPALTAALSIAEYVIKILKN